MIAALADEIGPRPATSTAEARAAALLAAQMRQAGLDVGVQTFAAAAAPTAGLGLLAALGALTIGVVTRPFPFEGKRRLQQAERGIDEMREQCDTLIVIPNERLLSLNDRKISMMDAFREADQVLLATGEHVRMPRLYRGRDVQWWLLNSGMLDQRIETMDDAARARRLPSPQLIGSDARETLDINAVQRQGVEVCGRLAGVRGTQVLFSGSLHNVCMLADLKMNRMLDGFDAWATEHGLDAEVGPVQRFEPTAVAARPRLAAELGRDVHNIVWATGYRPDFSWLDLPVFDRRGDLRSRPPGWPLGRIHTAQRAETRAGRL